MDELDRKIIRLLAKNARIPVKDIAQEINLTSPAVSSRIRKLEQDGIIGGYTVVLHPPEGRSRVEAFISLALGPTQHDDLMTLLCNEPEAMQCYRVTGTYSFVVKVSCDGVDSLEHLLNKFQKIGSTNTQVILSTPLDRPPTC